MAQLQTHTFLERMFERELMMCYRINRAFDQHLTRRFFAIISRLGDGVFWYALMVALPFVFGKTALVVSLRMFIVGLTGLLIYKLIKSLTSRERPYRKHHHIKLGTHPLDHYSFPSGHTLHATGFSTTAIAAYPELAWLLAPMSLLIAMSRVVLGLHYPTDVLAGAVLGCALAMAGIVLI